MRTPETLTAVQRHADLQRNSNPESANASSATPGSITPGSNEKMSDITKTSAQEKRLSAARQALTSTTRNATADIDPMDEADGSVTVLSPFEIDPYAKNPRLRPNPKRAELKASMSAEGRITNTITVTRRSPNDKYTPYGGGNTRIQIAQELLNEGDQRFAQLTVITVKWPGDAAVISAHLSENDNRGDISFWERAQGVASFKKTFEEENKTILSAAELNNVLKKKGLNYGIRMIQNFAFAVEHLSLIGAWLRTEDVNGVIKPNYGACLDVSKQFDKAKEVKEAIDEIFLMYCQDLEAMDAANLEKDPAEREEVKIDLQSLITDIQSVSSKALGLHADDMPAVLQAFLSQPKMSADELLKVRAGNTASGVPSSSGKQSPLGGMLGSVAGGNIQPFQNKPSSKQPAPGKSGNEQDRLASFQKRLTTELIALNDEVPIADFIVIDPDMPLGFLVDIPESMDISKDKQLSEEQSAFRESAWAILAMVSGQCNLDVVSKSTVPSKWMKAISTGVQAMTELCVAQGIGMRQGVIYVHSMQVWQLIGSPVGGVAFLKILSTITEFYSFYPEKLSIPYKQLFT
ncbi:hypothetical protein [Alicycliphilus denitrificans]|uniref:hypothetical protein n=1 Tax=Alicycliphilus denitrificans TaxID=179636 RepID=UPI00384E6056